MDHDHKSPRPPRRAVRAAGIMLAGAGILALAAAWIAFGPRQSAPTGPVSPAASPTRPALGIAAVEYATPFPTRPPLPALNWVHPTAAAAEIAAALNLPVNTEPDTAAVERQLNPLTILPARSRSAVMTYTVRTGDTLRAIAEAFGLDQSTIIWSNERFYVNALRVGMELNILPVNGVYHRVQEPQTIAAIADLYQVDPYAIIDSEFNSLFGARPDMILPVGLAVVVPGGTGSTEPIYWDPGVVISTSGSAAGGTGVSVGTDYAAFAVGDPGSCGRQAISGGSPPYSPPLYAHYKISQDFSWTHGGIDLAVPVGTPVYAAGAGTVIFKGWSTWGYGYTIVIAHGSTLSIYGHLNGDFVSCGQAVSAGQNIAVTGNSGRSSGPHLHFEIRGPGGTPVNPWDYQNF